MFERDEDSVPAADYQQEPPEGGSLVRELERLRNRANQQDESLARLTEALCALRRSRQALDAENRELRLALRESQRSGASPQAVGLS